LNRTKMLKYINPVIAVLIVSQLLSALFSDILHRETFELLHEGGGVLLCIGVLVHVVLNWGWVKATFLRK